MMEVMAVVRMNKMNQTKKALTTAGIDAFFAHEVQGRGQGFVNTRILEGVEDGYEEAAAILGEKGKLYPKRLVTVVVPQKEVKTAVDIIIDVNRTGKPGDGKIFVLPMTDAIRIRTGETGEKSIL